MTERSAQLYRELQNESAIKSLIGKSEDAYFDCKEWPNRDEDAQKMIAKAACGLTNAEGGVLVIGMKAEAKSKDEPDVVSADVPVNDTALVKSRVLSLIGNLVEPGIVGLQIEEIPESSNCKSGFVIVYVPANDGPPRRSRKDWKFYQRIGSGTFPMEYYQIESMFGARPRPKLELSIERVQIGPEGFDMQPKRIFSVGLKNEGRSLAKFPGIRFERNSGLAPAHFGVDGNGHTAIPLRASESRWVIFRGGIDDVVYPADTLIITKLVQAGRDMGAVGPEMRDGRWIANNPDQTRWMFPAFEFVCEVSCEGLATIVESRSFDEEEYRA